MGSCVSEEGWTCSRYSKLLPGSGDTDSTFCCIGLATVTVAPADVAAVAGLNRAPGEDGSSPKIFHYILIYK
jgi:hypothetical protein